MEPLEEGNYYHIYNRGAGRSPIFWSDDDYAQFIKKYFYYLFLSVETYAWCLLRNHFHFLIRIRTIEEQKKLFLNVKQTYPVGTFFGDQYKSTKPYIASKQFNHLFNSYTKSINVKKERSGTLSEGAFKRKKIIDEDHFLHIACYIHRNPIHHQIVDNYDDYDYSSYREIAQGLTTFTESDQLLTRFGGMENFIIAHREFKLMLGEEFYLE